MLSSSVNWVSLEQRVYISFNIPSNENTPLHIKRKYSKSEDKVEKWEKREKQWDKLSPDWEKEGKIHTESEFLVDLVVCIGFEHAKVERENNLGRKVLLKNIESILETMRI